MFLMKLKVGAPVEVVERLTAARQEFEARQTALAGGDEPKDPELDQFLVMFLLLDPS